MVAQVVRKEHKRELVVLDDETAVVHEAARRTMQIIQDVLATQERADIAVTGGTDGIAMLAAMAGTDLESAIDWSRVHLWWGDERFVQVDDSDRNAKQAREAWFGRLATEGRLPERNVHEMPADVRSREVSDAASDEVNTVAVSVAAGEYAREIVRELGSDGTFDLAIFGVGPDGHFASLFPGKEEIAISDPAVTVVGVTHSPKMPPLRVSLTVPFIQTAHRVMVVASKEHKSEVIARGWHHPNSAQTPVSFASGALETVWVLDKAAAQRI